VTQHARMSLFVLLAGCGSPSLGSFTLDRAPARALDPAGASVQQAAQGDRVALSGDTGAAAERCTMNGGGWLVTPDGVRVSQGHALHAPLEGEAARFQVSWGRGHRFQLERLETGLCLDDPAISPTEDANRLDTYVGTGVGRFDQGEGSIFFTLTDGGEGGAEDVADIVIYDAAGLVVLDVSERLVGGDHRSQ
jgi:hypothetical protein